jgi:hypothetical protein
MKEHCINLTADEIRAYQDGDRTLRRRVKPPPREMTDEIAKAVNDAIATGVITHNNSPFGSPGDTLVLREAWCFFDRYSSLGQAFNGPEDPKSLVEFCGDSESGKAVMAYWNRRLVYAADGPFPHIENPKWRSSVSMPRWAARYTPTVRRVRVEQVDGVWWWVAEVEA